MFVKGKSGNPRGRPRGRSRPVFQDLVGRESLEAIVEMLKESALAGDVSAQKILIEKSFATPKASDHPIQLAPAKDAAQAAKNALQAVVDGELSPDEGKAICDVAGAVQKITELADFEARLTALESRHA